MSLANMGSNLNTLALLNISHTYGHATNGYCTAYGFFAIFFYVAGAIWAVVIANTLSFVLVRRNELMANFAQLDLTKDKEVRKWRTIKIHSGVWGISFICAIIPASGGYFEVTSNNWCWYSGDAGNGFNKPNDRVEFWTYFVPITVAVIYCLSVFVRVMWNIVEIKNSAKRTRDPLNAQLYELTQALKYYPMVSLYTLLYYLYTH